MRQGAEAARFFEENIQIHMAGNLAGSMCVPKDDFEKLCFHEAAHSIVARYFGRVLGKIQVDAVLGGVSVSAPPETLAAKALATEPPATLADEMAGAPSDADRILQHLKVLVTCDYFPDLDQLHRATARILADRWHEVSRIVRHLLARAAGSGQAELTAQEVEELAK